MRTGLILLQAGLLSFLAVYGAHSDGNMAHACPLPAAAHAGAECIE
ncbi:MAG: hypothetical protein RQ750_09825 [Roseovarius sp.]|nr:hypothetical protein [Roseovarius sp.]